MSEIAYVVRAMRLDDYAVVQLLTNVDVTVGQEVEITGVSASFNDSGVIVTALPQYEFIGVDNLGELQYNYDNPVPNQVLYQNPGTDVVYYAVEPYGLLEWNPVCTWVTNADVESWLGIAVASANDTAFITKCVSAANAFAYRRRQESGYLTDELTISPGGDCTLGTIMYAALLYRERGSADSFASFDAMGTIPVPSALGRILQLLGVGRPQVA
jgi:hypothetical protein